MWLRIPFAMPVAACVLLCSPGVARAGSAELLSVQAFQSARALDAPIANAAFAPREGALPAPAFAGVLKVRASVMQTLACYWFDLVELPQDGVDGDGDS